jgi:hypothetical protein
MQKKEKGNKGGKAKKATEEIMDDNSFMFSVF